MTDQSLQQKMLAEAQNEALFNQAEQYGINYLRKAFDRNVFPLDESLKDLAHFDEPVPDAVGNAEEVLEMLNNYGAPATVSQVGGRYFGFVNGGVVPAGLLAKNLSIFWDQNAAMEVISPVAAKLEVVVQRWLIELLGLPDETVAGFVSGTSMANFCALAAARSRLLQQQGYNLADQGMVGAPRLRIVTSVQAHSTILKAISLLGFGKSHIEWVEVDDQGCIRADLLPTLDDTTILILQAGNVNSGAFDDFEAICRTAYQKGAWVHIDGAFGLWAGATQKLNHLTKGSEWAHSWAVDGHKTLNTPYDSGIVLCRDPSALTEALHMSGSYLVKGQERDGMFYTPEMSRRARVIELWATIKYLGRSGIDEMIFNLHQRAQQFAEGLAAIAGFEVLNRVVFNQVIVQCASDGMTEAVMKKVQELRECWVGGSQWENRKVIRISVCNWATTERDVERSIASFGKAFLLASKGED